ncbi:MAG: hypothetical protein WD377_02575 [Nitriliruptoraceae bacterium]
MMRIRSHVLVAILALAMAACASTAPDTPVSSPVEGPDAAGGARETLPPARDLRPEATNLRERPFERALSDETDGSFHIMLSVGREPCYALGRVDVVETAERVTITVFEGDLPTDGDTACPDDAQAASVPIDLERGIGDREVIDGATDEPVVVDIIRASTAPMS